MPKILTKNVRSCNSSIIGLSKELPTADLPTLRILLLLAFPFSQGWPQRTIILHIFLSSTSISFAPNSPISSFTTSKNLLFWSLSLSPLCRITPFPSFFFLHTLGPLLMTCPYHLSLPSLIFIPNRSILTVLLMCSLLILSFSCHSHSKSQHFHLCDIPSLPLVSL